MRARSPIASRRNAIRATRFKAYESARREATAKVVRTNREHPRISSHQGRGTDGDKPFQNLDDFITQDSLRALSENYKRIGDLPSAM